MSLIQWLSQSWSELSSQPLWLRLLIASLATWRLSSLLVNQNEAGPGNVLHRIRDWTGVYRLGPDDEPITDLGKLFSCVWCMSVWVSLFLVGIAITPFWVALIPFALSAVAILMQSVVDK